MASDSKNHDEDDEISHEDLACYCNAIEWGKIERAIAGGAKSLSEIAEQTSAGEGPCGGSCRPRLCSFIKKQQEGQQTPEPEEEAPAALVQALSLFNRRYYWECHEVLEHEWMDEVGPRRLFYQGLIQAAAALYHVLGANPKGVIRLAQEARKKLDSYQPVYLGVGLAKLDESLAFFISESKEMLAGQEKLFDYEKLPILKFQEPADSKA